MTTPHLISDLKSDEGCRTSAYPDPLTNADPFTIGYGHTGAEVHPGLTWTQPQCETALETDVAAVVDDLDDAFPWWRDMSDLRQDVLANMTFNMGIGGVSQFHNTLRDMEAGNYEAAADGMLDSLWAKQVPNRANRLAEQMRTGVHA